MGFYTVAGAMGVEGIFCVSLNETPPLKVSFIGITILQLT